MNLTKEQIRQLIPHRAPFLFVDTAEVLGTHDIRGFCSWDADNPIFAGHFPEFPVVPGVAIVEAAAQLAGILISYDASQKINWRAGLSIAEPVGALIGIRRASFHRSVMPGDQIVFTVTVENPIGGMVSTKAIAFGADGVKICGCDLSVAVVDRGQLANSYRP